MISLRNHDRVGRTTSRQDPTTLLPSLEQRAAIARSWASSRPTPQGVRRDVQRAEPRREISCARGDAVASVMDSVIEGLSLGADDDIEGIRAFATRLLSR